jgi:hypothetical protein
MRVPVSADGPTGTARLKALEVPSARHGGDGRPPREGSPRQSKRRGGKRRLLLALGLCGCVAVAGGLFAMRRPGSAVPLPNMATLSPLRAKIVTLAVSQVGYTTDPSGTYCNKYSAYWNAGADDCGNSNLDEEWCADFAAWVWQKAGAAVTYQFVNGDLNSSAASFYEWGVDRGTWHPAGSGYVPVPGDVAVYGLDTATLQAAHVAIVIGYQAGDRGPTAVNGDGDLTAFSVVEVRYDEYLADTHPSGAPLSGYVSPTPGSTS